MVMADGGHWTLTKTDEKGRKLNRKKMIGMGMAMDGVMRLIEKIQQLDGSGLTADL
jgi:hypothetical protein